MYKNQLQELAQRSCFNLPAYTCIREGPDHAPRFKAVVNFNGENFESPVFCTTLRQAEHAAAEVALGALSKQGPSRSLAARVLDETGVYKNLLQETAHRAGLNLPVYTIVRSGPGHTPVFTCTVELAGISFMGDPAKTKKQAQKNAASAAWSALKQLPHVGSSSSIKSSESSEQQEQVVVARALAKLCSLGVSKQSLSSEWQRGRQKMSSTRDNMNLASDPSLNSAPVPYQSLTSSNLLLEIETYEPGHQEHSPLCQSQPSSVHCSESRNLQNMQQIIQSAQAQYFPISKQDNLDSLTCFTKTPSSSLFFSGYPSVPPGDQVSLQETQEENGVRRNVGWLGSGISDVGRDPINQRTSFQPNPMMYSSYEVSSQTLSVDRSTEFKFQDLLKSRQGYLWSNLTDMSSEEKNCSSSSGLSPIVPSCCDPFAFHDSGAGRNNLEVNQCESTQSVRNVHDSFAFHDWSHHGQTISKPSSAACFMFGSTQSVRNVQSRSVAACTLALNGGSQPLNLSPQFSSRASMPVLDVFRTRDSFLASPVNIRTTIPVCSARRGCSSSSASQANSVAPAVHVRSVAPVCSAPSTRRIQSTKVMHEQEELSTQMGRFGKLHI